jgi:hypothetical protein
MRRVKLSPEACALELLEWVKGWKTWHAEFDEEVALSAILAELNTNPEVIVNLKASNRRVVKQARFELGVIAVTAARDAHPFGEAIQAAQLGYHRKVMTEEEIEREVERLMRQLDAELFLILRLVDGPIPYQTLSLDAAMEGITPSRLYAARERLDVFTVDTPHRTPALWAIA